MALSALFCAWGEAQEQFVHPSIISTQEGLDYARTVIASDPDHPMTEAFGIMAADPYASLTYTPAPLARVNVSEGNAGGSTQWFADGQAARTHALMWAITGNPAHRDKAIEILDGWASVFQEIHDTKGNYETVEWATASWGVPMWAGAAELIRYYDNGAAGWPGASIQRFSEFLDKLYVYAYEGTYRTDFSSAHPKNNKGASSHFACMAIGIFQNDMGRYSYGRSKIEWMLPLYIQASGKVNFYDNRDLYHPLFGLISLAHACETAWNQGDDLYAVKGQHATPCLARAFEYYANEYLQLSSEGGTYGFFKGPGWEVARNHYKLRRGMSLPKLEQMLLNHARPRMGRVKLDMWLLWNTVTHGELGAIAAAPGPDAPSELTAGRATSTGVELSWHDNSNDETHFVIQYKVVSGPFQHFGTAVANTTMMMVDGLQPSTPYTFRVQAASDGGFSAWSNEASATTAASGAGGEILYEDGFGSLDNWTPQFEAGGGGTATAANNAMTVHSSKGWTIWYNQRLTGPVKIEYDVTLPTGQTNSRVSDLNVFWMASDPADPTSPTPPVRNGALASYDNLALYYVGTGGNNNSTTRFRRYPGDGTRPMLPEHDLTQPRLQGNRKYHVTCIANGNSIQYYLDDLLVFDFADAAPFTSGFFGFRSVDSRQVYENFKVTRISGSTGGGDTTAPGAPQAVTAAPNGTTAINLDWADNGEPDLAGYNLYRSMTDGFAPGAANRIGTALSGSSYFDSGLASATTYYYRVSPSSAVTKTVLLIFKHLRRFSGGFLHYILHKFGAFG